MSTTDTTDETAYRGADPDVRPHERSSTVLYRLLAILVLVVVPIFCFLAARLGNNRFDDLTAYFYEWGDVGHPGIVNVITAAGFFGTAVVACVLGVATGASPQSRATWLAAAALFVIVALDDLLRIHNSLPHGDVLFRVGYWTSLAVIAVRLRALLAGRRGVPMLVFGFVMLAVSEILDFSATIHRGPFPIGDRLSVIEETAACLGGWSLAVASIGFATSILTIAPAGGPRQ